MRAEDNRILSHVIVWRFRLIYIPSGPLWRIVRFRVLGIDAGVVGIKSRQTEPSLGTWGTPPGI